MTGRRPDGIRSWRQRLGLLTAAVPPLLNQREQSDHGRRGDGWLSPGALARDLNETVRMVSFACRALAATGYVELRNGGELVRLTAKGREILDLSSTQPTAAAASAFDLDQR